MQARARKSALLEAAAVLVSEVLDELSEGGEDGETDALADVVETLTDLAWNWSTIEFASRAIATED